MGAQGPPRWLQGASQDPFFLILGAPGCLPGAIFHDFLDTSVYIFAVFLVWFSATFLALCRTPCHDTCALAPCAQPSAVAGSGAAHWIDEIPYTPLKGIGVRGKIRIYLLRVRIYILRVRITFLGSGFTFLGSGFTFLGYGFTFLGSGLPSWGPVYLLGVRITFLGSGK